MVRLRKTLPASSLLECAVAAVILLFCFSVTMEILVRITLAGNDPVMGISVEVALKEGYREYGDGEHFPGKYRKDYDWGTLEVELTEYSGTLHHLILTARSVAGIKTVRYDYLIKKKL